MDNIKLLIVEDDEDIARMISMTLARRAQHLVIAVAEGGKDCLEYLKDHAVDCIISDYQMPGMDGMELLVKLREEGNNVPFIFLTAQGNEEIASEAFRKGAYDYFTKNIGFAHFTRIINSVEQAVKQRKSHEARLVAEKGLRAEKDKLEAILAGIGDGISIQDPEFRVLYQNKAHSDLIGVHTGEYCYEAYERQSSVCCPCPVYDAFRDGETHRKNKCVELEAGPLHVDITASVIKDQDGKIIAGIEIVRDVTPQKLAEEALRDSEERYRMLFNSGTDEVHIVQLGENGMPGKFIAVNDAACNRLGYTHEEFLSLTPMDINPPEALKNLPGSIVNLLTDNRATLETVHVAKDGNRMPVEVNLSLFDYKGKPTVYAVARDIRRRKHAEEKMAAVDAERKKAEERLRKLSKAVEQSSSMITIASPSCAVEYVNPKFTELTGFALEEVVGIDANTLRVDFSGQCSTLQDTIKSGNDWKGEFMSRRKDGGMFWVNASISPIKDEDGQISNFVCVQEDITERKNAEEEMARLVAAVVSTADAICVTDMDGVIKYVNPAFEEMSGYTRDEAVGMTPGILLCGSAEAGITTDAGDALRSGRGWTGGGSFCRKDGTRREIEATVSPVKGPSGEVKSYVAVARDVTDRKRLESIAESVNSMNNLGYVFASVRHEVGGPLNALKMALELLNANITDFPREKMSGFLVKCLEEIGRVEYLMQSLKSFNMFERPALAATPVDDFLGKLLSLMRNELGGRGITVSLDMDCPGCRAMMDPRAMQQAMLNLFSNAADALEGAVSPRINIRVTRERGVVVIRVSDNGAGMTEEQMSNLFKPFHTSKPNGTGLGLVIAKKMIATMGGTIEITSTKGHGTTVELSLPEVAVEEP